MGWKDITINSDEADFPRLLQTGWDWLLLKPYRPVLMTAFGDWFLTDEMGCAFFLDLLEGSVQKVAESLGELNSMFQMEAMRDNWFLTGFVIAMQRADLHRPHGKTYAYKVHPIIGGKTESSNLMLLDIEVWQSICGQLHQQVKRLAPGTRILGIESLDKRTIKLKTDADGDSQMKVRVAVHPVVDENGGRRIAIYRKANGCYMYAEERRVMLTSDVEPIWTSEFDHDTRSGVYDSAERALQEAEREVLWLKEQVQLRNA